MKSEALRNIRTMRQVRTGPLGRMEQIKTANSLGKTSDEIESLKSLSDRRLSQALEKERRHFAAQEAGIDKSRRRILKAREKLAATINKNKALTKMRHELQQARWEAKDTTPSKREESNPEQNLREIELKY